MDITITSYVVAHHHFPFVQHPRLCRRDHHQHRHGHIPHHHEHRNHHYVYDYLSSPQSLLDKKKDQACSQTSLLSA